jgi:hypothetical protein
LNTRILLFAIFHSYFGRQVGNAHILHECLNRLNVNAEGSLSTSIEDDATDWSNLRESCGGWLKCRHRPEFAVFG